MRILILATALALGSLLLTPTTVQAQSWGRLYGSGYTAPGAVYYQGFYPGSVPYPDSAFYNGYYSPSGAPSYSGYSMPYLSPPCLGWGFSNYYPGYMGLPYSPPARSLSVPEQMYRTY